MADHIDQQFGNYRLIRLLGRGGQASVYLGEHVRLKMQAVVKILHTLLTEQDVVQFQQEAQLIADLTHPHIVRLLDFDVRENIPFLVMDYAPNGSLREHHPRGEQVPLPTVLSSVQQMASALQYAHEQHILHRDIKPENMLLGRQQTLLLSDFGLAVLLAGSHSSELVGKGGGTYPYMAPEQLQGHPRRASDQYALAVVVYEWLAGKRPLHVSQNRPFFGTGLTC